MAYYRDFEKEKLSWIELSDIPKFSFDNKGYFVEATAFIMTGDRLKYLSAFLNSKLCDWYYDKITTTSGVGTNRWKKIYIENLPIPNIDKSTEKQIEIVINQIHKKLEDEDNIKVLEDELNQMILDLFSFTKEERELILNFKH